MRGRLSLAWKIFIYTAIFGMVALLILFLILMLIGDIGGGTLALILVLSAVVLTALCLSISAVISRLIFKRLGSLIDFTRKVSLGEMRERLPEMGKDVLGDLAAALNEMAEGLGGIIDKIRASSALSIETTQQLAASSQQVTTSTQEVASTIQQISRGAQNQARNVEVTTQDINQIADVAMEVARKAWEGVDTSHKASDITREGGQSAEIIAQRMAEIRESVEEAAQVIKGLGDRSMQIGLVVDVITSISNQTNMLALNAAIEASRAGEQGRGFAVVAEEVRGLAKGSRQAADQIAKMIRDTESETGRVVKVMEGSKEKVSASIDVINNTAGAFKEIAVVVDDLTRLIEMISEAADRQKDGAERAAKSAQEIAAIAEETAASTEEVSATAQEQTASIQEITASIQELARTAELVEEALSELHF